MKNIPTTRKIEVLVEAKGLCVICGRGAALVHHIDEDPQNNELENLIALCNRCHKVVHNPDAILIDNRSPGAPSKYLPKYGYAGPELQRMGLSYHRLKQAEGNPEAEAAIRKWIEDWTAAD